MLTVFNQGGQVTITPTLSDTPDLEVTIEGTLYSTAWDTNVATTIDNWVASHAQTVADRFGIASIDGATVLTLQGVASAKITVNEADGNVVASAITSEISTDLSAIQSRSATATTLVYTMKSDAGVSGNDVLTLTFVSAADRVKGQQEVANKIVAATRDTGSSVFNVACSAALA